MKIVTKPCKLCGVPFEGPLGRKYCCAECKRKGSAIVAAQLYEKRKAERASKKKKKICPGCGGYFYPRGAQKYCGLECYPEWRKRQGNFRNKSEMMPESYYRCGRHEFLLLDGTMQELKVTGESYAERQKKKTLEGMPKIDVAGFMEDLKRG